MRRVVGCMTGTSIDALDASLVEIEGHGLAMQARPVRNITRELGELAPRLRALAEQTPMTAGQIAALARDFALLHAEAILEVLAGEKADLVCVHGQTVFHQPPLSWQLMQPSPIAAAVGCPVVYDLRQADLAAGGQGAPITPLADWVLFRSVSETLTIVNLGGFANFTYWNTDTYMEHPVPGHYGPWFEVKGGDVCACNQLLDGVARRRLKRGYDEDGSVASAGVRNDGAFRAFRDLLSTQSGQRRSLGTGDELESLLASFDQIESPSLLRSACEAIAETINERVGNWSGLLAAGGGVRNKALMTALGSVRGSPVQTTGDYGVPIEYREAICFAVLGALCQDKVPITIPAVTGVTKAPLSGAWVYP
jgi:anhydro-N-acetylmuramic acid kinase